MLFDGITINSHYARIWASVQATGQLLHHDNIICLTGQPIGCETSVPSLERKEAFFMSTYEEFMVLLTFGILVIAILEYVNHKK